MSRYADLNTLKNMAVVLVLKAHPELQEHQKEYRVVQIQIFPQTWANTAGGFSEAGSFSGQAMTEQITTVFEIEWMDKLYYLVFFDENPAYMVEDAPQRFLDDLGRKRLLPKDMALKYY